MKRLCGGCGAVLDGEDRSNKRYCQICQEPFCSKCVELGTFHGNLFFCDDCTFECNDKHNF